MSEIWQRPGCEPCVKPLALYRDRLRSGFDPTEARFSFYQEVLWKWWRIKGRKDLFDRHFPQIMQIALREIEHVRKAA